MSATDVLLKPEEYVMSLVDFQVGLGFGVESMPRKVVVNNAVALARTGRPSRFQILLEFHRDWTRYETYEAARAVVVANGGGYGMGLAYAREMIHPA